MKGIIYQIKNMINDKIYIGRTKNPKSRKISHYSLLNQNKHSNKHLQNAWNKYGSDNFKFILLKEYIAYDSKTLLKILTEAEQYFLDTIRPWDRSIGYNISKKAEGSEGNKHKRSDSTKEKIRIANIGKKQSRKTIQKRIEKIKGIKRNPLTDDTKSKISRSLLGKMSYDKNPMYGKKHSSVSKEKMSAIKIGKPSKRKINISIEDLQNLYFIEKMSMKKISIILNVSHSLIKNRIKEIKNNR